MSIPTQEEIKADMLRERCAYAHSATSHVLAAAKALSHGLYMANVLGDEESKTRAILAAHKEAEAAIAQAQSSLGALKHMAIYAGLVKA